MPADERKVTRLVLEAMVSSQNRRVLVAHDTLVAQVQQRDASLDQARMDAVLRQLVDSRLLRSDEDEDDEPVYELAHDYLLGEIELDPEVLAQKAAQELLRQEADAYERFGTLLSKQKYDIVASQRDALVLEGPAERLLTESGAAIQAAEEAA